MVHQAEFMADMVDGVDNIVELREIEFLNIAPRDQVIDRGAVTLGVDRYNTFTQHFDLGALDTFGQSVQLTVGIADVNIIVIDQRNIAYARARAGFRRPGAYAADAYDTKLRPLQGFQRGYTKYSAQAAEALQVFFAQHLINF
jgi:hypothetical protein